jgi:hypothetical protein
MDKDRRREAVRMKMVKPRDVARVRVDMSRHQWDGTAWSQHVTTALDDMMRQAFQHLYQGHWGIDKAADDAADAVRHMASVMGVEDEKTRKHREGEERARTEWANKLYTNPPDQHARQLAKQAMSKIRNQQNHRPRFRG